MISPAVAVLLRYLQSPINLQGRRKTCSKCKLETHCLGTKSFQLLDLKRQTQPWVSEVSPGSTGRGSCLQPLFLISLFLKFHSHFAFYKKHWQQKVWFL